MHGTSDIIRANSVPPNLRFEVAKLYDEHGGIDILMNLTRVGYTTLKQWHKEYLKDPESLTKARYNPDRVSKADFVRRVLDGNEIAKRGGKAPVARFVKTKDYKNARTPNELKNMLPEEVVNS